MLEAESDKLLKMEERLAERVVGQDEAVRAVSRAVRRGRVGLRDPGKPIGSFLFLGPSGVGKTELAKALAEFLFDDEQSLTRLDMSEFMEKHMAQRLVGAPPGYVDSEEGGFLTEAVRRRPYSVLLFDEVEKAHADVFNLLLQVLDDGRLTDGRGRTADFSNTVVIMTSNIGSKRLLETDPKLFETRRGASRRCATSCARSSGAFLRPEFLNRIDDVVLFRPLSKEDLRGIVDIQLRRLEKLLDRPRAQARSSPRRPRTSSSSSGYEPAFGARPLKRAILKKLQDPLAEEILRGGYPPGSVVKVDVDGRRVRVREGLTAAMRVHLVGVSGTGMGALAALFARRAHDVSGSDVAFDPPIGPDAASARRALPAGLRRRAPRRRAPDLVVVGNAIRRDNPEAVAAERARPPARVDVAARCASTSSRSAGRSSSPARTARRRRARCARGSCRARASSRAGSSAASRKGLPARRGDRLDAACGPDRGPRARSSSRATSTTPSTGTSSRSSSTTSASAPTTSPSSRASSTTTSTSTPTSRRTRPRSARSCARCPRAGSSCATRTTRARATSSPREARGARRVVRARAATTPGDVTPDWLGAPAAPSTRDGAQAFDLFAGGVSCGRFALRVPGRHNVRNALAAIAACAEGFGVSVDATRARTWRRSRACAAGRSSSASRAACASTTTSRTTRPPSTRRCARCAARHPGGALWVVFEPRSATACRALHQEAYARAFDAADHVLLAPLGRSEHPRAPSALDLDAPGARARATRRARRRASRPSSSALAREARRRATPSRSSRTARSAGSTQKLLDALEALEVGPCRVNARSELR